MVKGFTSIVTKGTKGGKKYTKIKYVRTGKVSSKGLHTNVLSSLRVGFPKNKTVMMRYCSLATYSTASGGVINQYWSANNLYDPDFTGTGHQPLGYDQWTQFYNHNIVKKAKITVTVTGQDSSETGAGVIALYLSDDATSTTTLENLIEQGKCNYKLINGFMAIGTKTVRATYDPKKFFNITDIKDNKDRLGATFGVAPSAPFDPALFRVAYQDVTATSGKDVTMLVTIDYIVDMSEPKELTGS